MRIPQPWQDAVLGTPYWQHNKNTYGYATTYTIISCKIIKET